MRVISDFLELDYRGLFLDKGYGSSLDEASYISCWQRDGFPLSMVW